VQYAGTVQEVVTPAMQLPAGQQTAMAVGQGCIVAEGKGQEAAMHLWQTILLATALRNARPVTHVLEALLGIARRIIPMQPITADSTMEVQRHAVLQTTTALLAHTSRHKSVGQVPHIPTAKQRPHPPHVQYAETVQAALTHAMQLPAEPPTAMAVVQGCIAVEP